MVQTDIHYPTDSALLGDGVRVLSRLVRPANSVLGAGAPARAGHGARQPEPHTAAVRALIEAAGCRLLYLPPYSPDLNPIEQAWSKLKTLLRGAAARTREALEDALAAVLDQITAADARSWFAHCGYAIAPN